MMAKQRPALFSLLSISQNTRGDLQRTNNKINGNRNIQDSENSQIGESIHEKTDKGIIKYLINKLDESYHRMNDYACEMLGIIQINKELNQKILEQQKLINELKRDKKRTKQKAKRKLRGRDS